MSRWIAVIVTVTLLALRCAIAADAPPPASPLQQAAMRVASAMQNETVVLHGYKKSLAREGLLRWAHASGRDALVKWTVEAAAAEGLSPAGPANNRRDPFNCPGYWLYQIDGDEAWKPGLIEQTAAYRRSVSRSSEGAIEHPRGAGRGAGRGGGQAMLIDALQDYASRMAMFGRLTGDESACREAVEQHRIYRAIVREPETGLWRQGRGWREDRSELSPGTWSRGHGWLIRGMVDTLLLLPPESAEAAEMRRYLKELADALLKVQQPDGMWHCLLTRPPSQSPPETSGTALIAGNLAIAVHHGFLPAETYSAAAHRAFEALPGFVDENGVVHSVSPGPGPLSEEGPWIVDRFEPGDEHGPFAILFAALGEALLNDASRTATSPAAAPPNIVFIISDDQDFEHLGFMGGEHVHTPNLDRLAGAGTVFTTGYLPMSVCRPTLASFMSGQLPHQSGVYTNYLQNHRIGHDTKHIDPQSSIGNQLKRAGYATYATGKFWEGDPREQGFTHGTVDISFGGFLKFVRKGQGELFGFIDEHAGKQPMFIWWAPLLPHLPHNPPQKYLDLYPRESIRVPQYVAPERRESFVDDERNLLATTTWLDDGVGELVAKLEAAGQMDNTLFVFVIDNGWANGLPSKHSVGEKSLRTPMFFTWPGRVPAGRRIDAVTDTMDLYPTMLSYAGAPIPDSAAGRDLRPVLERKQAPRHEPVMGAIYPHYARFKGAHPEKDVLAIYRRDARWKLVWYVRDFTIDTAGIPGGAQRMLREDFDAHDAGDVDLFDIRADPYEQHDLADDPAHRDRVERYKREMLQWWQRTGGAPIPGVDP